MLPTLTYLARLWLGVLEPVGRRAYIFSGLALLTIKYLGETLLVNAYTGNVFWPWQFLNPLLGARMAIWQSGPDWLGWALFLWSLPFLWIGLTLSMRRAADASISPWWGLWIVAPYVNVILILTLCIMPNAPGAPWHPEPLTPRREKRMRSFIGGMAAGIGVAIAFGAVTMALSVYLLRSYGASLFIGTPLLMSATAAYIDNRIHPRTYLEAMGIGAATMVLACGLLLLFALEGAICLIMAAPLLLPLSAVGGAIGMAIAESTRRTGRDLLMALALLPIAAGIETQLVTTPEYEVLTAVEIDASPEVVWQHVIDFSDLTTPEPWHFRAGIASPRRARIVGQGVGAIRYCEFTTGVFVEPITVWDEPHCLAFNVTEQPAPMIELNPLGHVHPPHLDGYLRSKRGEFRLIPLTGGRTRLEGRTWYEFEMFPQAYWTLWSDLIVHRIHERVLLHIKRLCEHDQRA